MNLYFNTSQSIFLRDPTLQNIAWKLQGDQRVGVIDPNDPMPVSYTSTLRPRSLLDRVQFGDGYEQITESGVRNYKRSFDLRWNKLDAARSKALVRFLQGEGENSIYFRRPSEWFWWLPPAILRTDILPLKVICLPDQYSVTPVTWDAVDISATFEEVFMP